MISLRCSSLPLFLKCSQSVRGEVNVNEWNEESGLGRAVHAYAAGYVAGAEDFEAEVARLHGVDVMDLQFLALRVRQAWKEISAAIGDLRYRVLPEQEMATMILPDVELTGHADVLTIIDDGSVVDITDWKSGRLDGDYRDQVLGYCALALTAFPQAQRASARLVWLRALDAELYSMRREELEGFRERLRLAVADSTFRPAHHCTGCPRQFSCPGRADMLRASVEAMAVPGGDGSIEAMSDDEQLHLYHKAKEVSRLAERVLNALREQAAREDHATLTLVEESRRSLRPLEAWPVLQRHLPESAIAEAVKVSVTAVQDAVASRAPRGQGAAARRALMKELEDVGAVIQTTMRKLAEKRRSNA